MAGEILRPPRLTGNAEADLAGVVEFLWALYKALVTELQFVRSQDVDTGILSDAQLAALAALVPTASANLPYFTAEDAAGLTGLTAFMRTLLDDASASVARGTLGLGALAVLDTVGAAVLTDDSVTYAKIQEVPQDRILGRQTASTGNIEEITCTSAGRALIDDASASAQRTTLGFADGVYTPTLTNVANLGASTACQCQYMRCGTVVTVSGKVDIDPSSAATSTQLGISLPVASDIGAAEDCAGTAFASGIAGQGAAILGDAANNRAQLQFVSTDITNQAMYFTFTYRII